MIDSRSDARYDLTPWARPRFDPAAATTPAGAFFMGGYNTLGDLPFDEIYIYTCGNGVRGPPDSSPPPSDPASGD